VRQAWELLERESEVVRALEELLPLGLEWVLMLRLLLARVLAQGQGLVQARVRVRVLMVLEALVLVLVLEFPGQEVLEQR